MAPVPVASTLVTSMTGDRSARRIFQTPSPLIVLFKTVHVSKIQLDELYGREDGDESG